MAVAAIDRFDILRRRNPHPVCDIQVRGHRLRGGHEEDGGEREGEGVVGCDGPDAG